MFDTLAALNRRPEPFSAYTADVLWTDPHISAGMLEFHLDPTNDVASRSAASIDRIVDWLDRSLGLGGKAVCDLGCGPGLYAGRMAARGARVTGLDFSERSIAHARETAGPGASFRVADYLEDDLPTDQDAVLLIYGDLCALAPEQRRLLYAKVQTALTPGGRFVFDAFSHGQFEQREEGASYGRRLMEGFWAPGDYFGFLTTFLWDDLKLALDRYLIVEPDRRREVFNWLQYFSPETIEAELAAAGFEVENIVEIISGKAWVAAATEFAVVARRPA